MKLSLLLTTCLMLGACQNLPPANQPTPSPSASASPSIHPGAPDTANAYRFPLSLSLAPECSEDKVMTEYEILADGTFKYPSSAESPNVFEENTEAQPLSSIQLSQGQMDSLKSTLKAQDLATAFAATTPVAPDSPQTAECRTVSILKMQVDNKEQSYALNGRDRNTTEDYRTRWKAVRTQLEAFAKEAREANAPIPTEPEYAFPPLRFEVDGECGMGVKTLYTLEGMGQFKAYDAEGKVTTDRALSAAEQERLNAALNAADLNTRLENSTAVPADAPQTRECRMVEKITLPVYGVEKTFDRNSRAYNHSEAYVDGFEAIRTVLEDFAK